MAKIINVNKIPFQWARLGADKQAFVLQELENALPPLLKESIKERTKFFFDNLGMRKLDEKDILKIDMRLNVPVSMIIEIVRQIQPDYLVHTPDTTSGSAP